MGSITYTNGDTLTVPLIIDGKDVYSSAKPFTVVSTEEGPVWTAVSATTEEANAAVEAAQRAFPAWSATKPAARRAILLRAADILEQRADELLGYMRRETSAHMPFSQFNINMAAEILRDTAGRIGSALVGTAPVCEDAETHALVIKEPYGVVLGIAPWNAPFILGFRSVVFALAAGNTCVMKGSEHSPRCFWAIGSVFRDAGLPDGCVNVVFHRPEDASVVTTALIAHPAVKKINFTGSTTVGSIIASTAGRYLKPVLMELGGKNSAIVCADADLDLAAKQCALGAFFHAGQICMATERILVHESVIGAFTPKLQAAIAAIFAEDSPAQALAQAAASIKVRGLIKDALGKGAKVVHGATSDGQAILRPTVIGDLTKDMDLYHTESFGPCVSLISVRSDDEAVAVANDSEYGLSGAVFTKDLARGLSVARRIETGAVHINSMTVHDEVALPHGGTKKSGWGRFNTQAGIDEFLRTKTITFQMS